MEKKKKKKRERKKIVKKLRIRKTTYHAVYVGKHKHISYTGIGRVISGKEYLIGKKLAEALTTSKNWKVWESYSYTDIK